jgi:ketosteroid isomerase-like protein
MPEEKIELVERVFDAWNRGDYGAAQDFVDPDVEVLCSLGTDLDGTYIGLGGLTKLMGFWSAFGTFRSTFEQRRLVGDVVITLVHHRATGRHSGVEVEMSNWQTFRIPDRRIVFYGIFSTEAQALAASRPSD